MPSPERTLSPPEARRRIGDACLVPESPPRVGVELEWLTWTDAGPDGRLDPTTLGSRPTGVLPAGSRLTFEPGGQLEVSAPPHESIDAACASASADLATARAGVGRCGVRIVGVGADTERTPRRMVRSPRYDAMEAYFDSRDPLAPVGTGAGRLMMCNTAAVQVNVGLPAGAGTDLGDGGPDRESGWRLANRLGPTLAAAFANSPATSGPLAGWKSSRLGIWRGIDPSRTTPVPLGVPVAHAWADYAMGADVMLVRDEHGGCAPVDGSLSFGRWLVEGHHGGFPTTDDLDYHLSTLFPPVRPRGWLELRMVDALPDPWWKVPVAVVAAVLWDAEAGEAVSGTATATAGLWTEAAKVATGHPGLAGSARTVFDAAQPALVRLGAGKPLRDLVAEFADRYANRGRCPADDVLRPGRADANGARTLFTRRGPARGVASSNGGGPGSRRTQTAPATGR